MNQHWPLLMNPDGKPPSPSPICLPPPIPPDHPNTLSYPPRKPRQVPQAPQRRARHHPRPLPHHHLEADGGPPLDREDQGHRRLQLQQALSRAAILQCHSNPRGQPDREPPSAAAARDCGSMQGEGHPHHGVQPSREYRRAAVQCRAGGEDC